MLGYIIVALLLVPFIEVTLLIKVGQYLGSSITILLVVLTGVIGATLAKYHGLKVLWELRYQLSHGKMPGTKLLEGLFILVGGIFLLTPGFITDAIGFSFLLPASRQFFVGLAKKWLENYLRSGHVRIFRP